jgi:hypothetical protein
MGSATPTSVRSLALELERKNDPRRLLAARGRDGPQIIYARNLFGQYLALFQTAGVDSAPRLDLIDDPSSSGPCPEAVSA